MTFQYPVIEDQIYVVILSIDGQPLLSGFKTESLAKLQQKYLKMTDKSFLQVAFSKFLLRFQANKLEHVWITHDPFRCGRLCFFVNVPDQP